MLEYFPEPRYRIAIGHCKRCGDEIFDGDEVVEQDGYICSECKKAEAFEQATKEDLKEFISNCNHDDEFAEWFFEANEKVLETEVYK